MGEEAYEESVFSSIYGGVTIRGGYGRRRVWLGITSSSDPEAEPELGIWLSPRQQQAIREELGEMTHGAYLILRDRVTEIKEALELLLEQDTIQDRDILQILDIIGEM